MPWGLDIDLTVSINGQVISRPRFATMYWTGAQQLAHLTVNGAALRTGDLYGSGTVSSFRRDEMGSLLEITAGGRDPVTLPDGRPRAYLADGDTVTLSGSAPGPDGSGSTSGARPARSCPRADQLGGRAGHGGSQPGGGVERLEGLARRVEEGVRARGAADPVALELLAHRGQQAGHHELDMPFVQLREGPAEQRGC